MVAHSAALHASMAHCAAHHCAVLFVPCRPEARPALQRLRALAALAATAPVTTGDALLAELTSPHLDTHQRLSILDGLGAAAMVRGEGGRG